VVLDEIERLEGLIKRKADERASIPEEQASATDLELVKAQMEHRLGQFRKLMRTNTGAARVVLRKLLNGHPLKAYWTDDGGYQVRGGAWLTALLNPASDERLPGK